MAVATMKQFKGWKTLEKETHRWFSKDENACNDKAALEVVYNTKTDSVDFYRHVSATSYVELSENEIRLGYVQGYLSTKLGWGGYDWCKSRFDDISNECL